MGGQSAARLAGRHALVTGAARGIGAQIARALVADGARVTLLGRNAVRLQTLADELGASARIAAADVADPDAVATAMRDAATAFGPVLVLINNAGQAESAPFLKTSVDLWQRMLAVNLTGTFLCSQAALPDMLDAGWGRIINIASTAGQRGYAYVAAYTAAKHGVVGLTRSLALEVAKKGVTVNAVCPGYTETPMLESSVDAIVAATGRSREAARDELVAANPNGRLVTPAEVAAVVRGLCTMEAASTTGQAIRIPPEEAV
jgi:NAD(P)-dependent dehydrogenase (short-subunit alcohol dehydrogenase family)